MHKNNSFRNLVVIIIFILFIVGEFISYQYKDHKKSGAKIEISSNQSSTLVIDDSFPMNDEMGKKISYDKDNSNVQGYYEFTIKNTSDFDSNFEIYVSDTKYANGIHPNFIKMYLTDSNNNALEGYDGLAVPTYFNLKVSPITPIGRRLYYGSIKGGESQKYILRVWVGDAYAIGNVINKFSLDVYVEAD